MVRPDVAARKVARAGAWLQSADVIFSQPRDEFLGDVKNRDLASFYLLLAIQECVDLAAHWVADAGWTPPDDAASTFSVLADHEVIDRELSSRMGAAARLRNRIAHGYAALDHDRLYEEFGEGVQSLQRFLALMAEAIDVESS
jgi:uncharacterized protein YutE (UPF0331/DUF86 family)